MTRKDFEALAAVLLSTKPSQHEQDEHDGYIDQWHADVRAIAEMLAGWNAFRFDRFYAACGYETTEPTTKN